MNNYVLIFILILSSCSILKNGETDNDNWELRGEWTIVRFFGKLCFTCPTISFDTEDKGMLILPSSEKFKFNYSLSQEELIIEFEKPIDILYEGSFKFGFSGKKRLPELKLTARNQERAYFLVKKNNPD